MLYNNIDIETLNRRFIIPFDEVNNIEHDKEIKISISIDVGNSIYYRLFGLLANH